MHCVCGVIPTGTRLAFLFPFQSLTNPPTDLKPENVLIYIDDLELDRWAFGMKPLSPKEGEEGITMKGVQPSRTV